MQVQPALNSIQFIMIGCRLYRLASAAVLQLLTPAKDISAQFDSQSLR